MKRFGLIGAALFCATAAHAQTAPAPISAAALDPARLQAARQLVDVVLPPKDRDALFARMVDQIMANLTRGIMQGAKLQEDMEAHPQMAAVFTRFVTRQRDLAQADLKSATPALIEAYSHAFARRFTIEDMASIGAFFSTPAGQKYRVASSEILADPDIAKWQSEVAARSQARMPSELEKFMTDLKAAMPTKEDKSAS